MNLTNPALLLYREELPAEKTSRKCYLQIITHLQSYKDAFCDATVWAIISKKLGDILQIVSTNIYHCLFILISFVYSSLHVKGIVLITLKKYVKESK